MRQSQTRRLTCLFAALLLLGPRLIQPPRLIRSRRRTRLRTLARETPRCRRAAGGSIPVNLTAAYDGSFASAGSERSQSAAGITSVSDGQTSYPFAFAPSSVFTAYQGIMTNFPLAMAPPVNGPGSYGDPAFAYSTSSAH